MSADGSPNAPGGVRGGPEPDRRVPPGVRRRTLPVVAMLIIAAAGQLVIALRPVRVQSRLETLPPVPAPAPRRAAPPDLRPPQRAEAAVALQRAFAGALRLDEARADAMVAGDFNGDESPDLMVAVRAVEGRVADINADLANWIIQDPEEEPQSRTRRGSVQVREDDALLAVVHGYGPAGWRDQAARQAYVLKATIDGALDVRNPRKLVAQAAETKQPLPRFRGDLLYDVKSSRFLYWAGYRYAWLRTQL